MIKILGNGIYSMPEASKLLGITNQRTRAWFNRWPRGADSLLTSDYQGRAGTRVISFLDLVDAAVSATLLQKHNVSHHMIRRLRNKLRQLWHTNHPFARQEFYTNDTGRRVFYKLASSDGEEQLIKILDQQQAIPEVLLPFLKRVEYSSDTKLAQVLSLMGNVVLDPRRRCGKPIVRDTGMPTAILFDCYLATQSEDCVADWYSVTPEDVIEAVKFETEYRGIAA
jgi:uncharacterized protein (DUF433 family)